MYLSSINEKYHKRSELLTYHKSARVIDGLVADDTYGCIKSLQNSQFVIIKPDAIAAGKSTGILKFLIERGIRVIHSWPIFDFTEHEYEELYRYNIDLDNPKCMVGSLWCLRKQFESDPCMGLIISTEDEDNCVYDVTQNIKGHFNPYLARSGTIRHDFHSASMSLNLIHMSDDPISSYREMRIFLSKDEIRSILRKKLNLASNQAYQSGRFEQICTALGPNRTDGDFLSALLRTIKKLAFKLEADAPVIVKNIFEIRVPSPSKSPRDRLQELHNNLSKLSASSDPELRLAMEKRYVVRAASEALILLSDVTTWNTQLIRSVMNLSASAGVQVSYWDRLLLESNAFYSSHMEFLKLPEEVNSTIILEELD